MNLSRQKKTSVKIEFGHLRYNRNGLFWVFSHFSLSLFHFHFYLERSFTLLCNYGLCRNFNTWRRPQLLLLSQVSIGTTKYEKESSGEKGKAQEPGSVKHNVLAAHEQQLELRHCRCGRTTILGLRPFWRAPIISSSDESGTHGEWQLWKVNEIGWWQRRPPTTAIQLFRKRTDRFVRTPVHGPFRAATIWPRLDDASLCGAARESGAAAWPRRTRARSNRIWWKVPNIRRRHLPYSWHEIHVNGISLAKYATIAILYTDACHESCRQIEPKTTHACGHTSCPH